MEKIWVEIFVLNIYLILIGIIDIGMTIQCDNEGKFQIQHWPPLPIDDSVAILRIVQVRILFDLWMVHDFSP
jgi:hypothetical protein